MKSNLALDRHCCYVLENNVLYLPGSKHQTFNIQLSQLCLKGGRREQRGYSIINRKTVFRSIPRTF